MVKPLGYYVSGSPGHALFFIHLQEKYGSSLQMMTVHEKLYLITAIASHLNCTTPGVTRQEIFNLSSEICSLPDDNQIGLLEALISQIRWGENVELVHNS